MRIGFFASLALAGLAACSGNKGKNDGGADGQPDAGYDHTRVFENFTHDTVYQDVPYPAERVEMFRTPEALPDLDVRALAITEHGVWAGTATGLFAYDPAVGAFSQVAAAGAGPVVDLAPGPDGGLLIGREDRVQLLSPAGELVWNHPVAAGVTAVAALGADAVLGGPDGLWRITAAGDLTALGLQGEAISDTAVAPDGMVWAATGAGLVRLDPAGPTVLGRLQAPDSLPDDDVRAVVASQDGVAAASATGLAELRLDGSANGQVLPGVDGLATGDLTSLAERDGALLIGHALGATFRSSQRQDYYLSLRWLPADRVTATALSADGTRWIGTPAGISRIYLEPTTLAEKAALFDDILDERHMRMGGFVTANAVYDDPWDLSGGPRLGDDDNDGQWTETQLGADCLAYAATGDERYYERARAILDVMLMLFDVPALTFEAAGREPGFVTRSLVRDDEGSVFDSKADQPNWHRQEFEGRTYYWKDNTSADEYDGHFFGIPLFYDLCAKTEAEREEIRERIRPAMDYLIDKGYVLIDLDGEKTEDGHWNDLSVAVDGMEACIDEYGADMLGWCAFSRYGGGWLNSTEILAFLLATWHMTGDQKYYAEYERLHTEERYGEMIPIIDDTWTVTRPAIANHSDHEMAILVYHTLLRYEPNPERRQIWIQSLLDFYSYERAERNPFQVGAISAFVEQDVGVADAVRTLQELPFDWRQWRVDNGHRQDAERDVDDRMGDAQFDRVLPYDEIRSAKWNANPYAVAGGGDGRAHTVPMPYLIGYWLMRYYGVIETP